MLIPPSIQCGKTDIGTDTTNTADLPECRKADRDRPLHTRPHWQVRVDVDTEHADCYSRRWLYDLGSNPD